MQLLTRCELTGQRDDCQLSNPDEGARGAGWDRGHLPFSPRRSHRVEAFRERVVTRQRTVRGRDLPAACDAELLA
jgi:hypothetical protein